MILSPSNGFEEFFVISLVLDQGGDGKCGDGEPERTVRTRDGGENVQALGLAG